MIRSPFYIVFAITVVIRLSYAFWVQNHYPNSIYNFDSWSYLNIAKNCFDGLGFSQQTAPPFLADSARTPGYPLFIMFFHVINAAGSWIVFSQAVLGGFIAFITSKIASKFVTNKKVWIFAGLLVSLDLPSLYMGNVVATETLFTFFLLISLYYAIRYRKQKQLKHFLFTIITLSLATLVRPISLYLLLIAPIGLLWSSNLLSGPKLQKLVLGFGIIALINGSWVYRNYKTFQSPFYSSIGEVNLLFHTCTQIRSIAEQRQQKPIEMEYRHQLNYLNFNDSTNAIKPFREFAHKETKRVIAKHPITFAKMWGQSSILFFIKPIRAYFLSQWYGINQYQSVYSVEKRGNSNLVKDTLNQTPLLILLAVIWQILILGVVYLAILLSIRWWVAKNKNLLWIVVFTIAYFALISSLTEVDARFRVPVWPLLVLLGIPAFEKWLNLSRIKQ